MKRQISSQINAAARGLFALALVVVFGCEHVPEHCTDYNWACLDVTIENGPEGVYRVRVNTDDGLTTSTVQTPKKAVHTPLVYPLRFAIYFDEFDAILYHGEQKLEFIALGVDYDELGDVQVKFPIKDHEKKKLSVDFGPPLPDMAVIPPVDPGPVPINDMSMTAMPDMP